MDKLENLNAMELCSPFSSMATCKRVSRSFALRLLACALFSDFR